MQWVFLVLAVAAALIELHTGTFYLAAVAAAALLTTLLGVWVRDDLLILVFLLLCAMCSPSPSCCSAAAGRTAMRSPISTWASAVSIASLSPHGHRLIAQGYRGANWEAVMEDGAVSSRPAIPPSSRARPTSCCIFAPCRSPPPCRPPPRGHRHRSNQVI